MRDGVIWHPSGFCPPDVERIQESLPKSLARAVSLWSDRPAVLCNGKSHSFQDLACRAAGLASEIHEASHADGPVALVQSVGFDAIAAWFACALSGRPFVLLEPDHPRARLLEMIDEAGCTTVLVDRNTLRRLGDCPRVKLLIPDGRHGTFVPEQAMGADEPAMIFPTSGSTGKPKLVTYSSATLQVKVQSSIRLMRATPGARVLIASSHGNFGFLHHACVFLMAGGTLCLADIKARGFAAVREAILCDGIRHVRFTPSMFRKLVEWSQAREALLALDAVRFSGEPLLATDLDLAQSVLKPGCLIQNVYGSTESAMFLWSSDDAPAIPGGPAVPIGRIYPLSAYAIKPMEDGGEDGTTGELFIRSAFHALGDYQAGAIDPARFPLCGESSRERIYATGDMVRRLPDGCLVHLGRAGRMAKIRGNRVFLSEVENHLRAMRGITGAAVVERAERDGPVLYGFVTAHAIDDPAGRARIWLAERLPEFMRPQRIQDVSEIPLLPGGKVDYAALLDRIQAGEVETGIQASPRDDFGRLTELWNSVLCAGAHAHDADFLALGGDSLKLMTLSIEVERVFGRSLPMEEFVRDGTLSNLARLLGIDSSLPRVERPQGLRLRLARPGQAPVQGIALAMPGWNGNAPSALFGRAGLFLDHDLWAADFVIPKGTMRPRHRWWRAAVEIVEGIRQGAMPAPRVIFGFSFGGGLAWIVSRLLAETGQAPRFVVMVDAVPLHRLRAFRCPELARALARVSCMKAPPTLHVRRDPLGALGMDVWSTGEWKPDDNIRMWVDLPTVDHLEMARHDMLALAMEPITAFLAGHGGTGPVSPGLPPPDSLGVRVYNAVKGVPGSMRSLMEGLTQESPSRIRIDQLLPILHAIYATGTDAPLPAPIQNAWKKNPTSAWLQYTRLRMRRGAVMLCPEDVPCFFPQTVRIVERTLSKRQGVVGHTPARPLRLLGLAVDLGHALVRTAWARGRRRLSYPGWWSWLR